MGATIWDKNSWDTSTLSFCFWPVSSSFQCCLSQVTHQILHTNNGRARRQKSDPTISTETVVPKGVAYLFFRIWAARLHMSQVSNERTIGETVTLKKVECFFTIWPNVTVLCGFEDFVATKFCKGAASFMTNQVMSSNGSFTGIVHVTLYWHWRWTYCTPYIQ